MLIALSFTFESDDVLASRDFLLCCPDVGSNPVHVEPFIFQDGLLLLVFKPERSVVDPDVQLHSNISDLSRGVDQRYFQLFIGCILCFNKW